jgi:hypothetical protein
MPDRRHLLGVAALLVFLTTGCGGGAVEEDLTLREDPFVVRPFEVPGHAACYGPHRDGQWPGGPGPSVAQIREDLALINPHWDMIRIYGSTGIAGTLLEVIKEDNLDL